METQRHPFPHWIVEDVVPALAPILLPPKGSDVWEVGYDNDVERSKRTTRKLDRLCPALQALFAWMRQPDYVRFWGELAGVPGLEDDPHLWGGGLHVTDPGGFLQCHLDFDSCGTRNPGKRRAMNLIAFLNPVWDEAWGGALLLCDPAGQAVRKVYPAPGRLVAFETSDLSYHAVEQVSPDCPVQRVTAAVYFLAPAGPANTRARALFMPNRTGGVPAEVRLPRF